MSRSLSPPINTFLLGSSSGDGVTPAVYDALDRPSETNLLVLSYREGPDSWFQNWRTYVGDVPSEFGFVHVGVKTRSASLLAHSVPDSAVGRAPLPADAVADPTDLARIGVYASEYLEAWDGNGRETVLLLDSLTDLLEHVDVEQAFKFLHLLSTRVKTVDGHGYYLLDPSAHDDYSLAVVRELADAVVDLEEVQTA